ncbi:flagellin [Aquicoccus sp. G2-2]|uniref:flagellin n=1 Tax=Aquicoccus sp. G2-2 TaxID=3092120 RepID=UPI002ADF86A2|nr:flagellin [Aquicoccus sp. G2-2]MEA1114382.1 flagellin [Aquicoccus sp. G2-2]
MALTSIGDLANTVLLRHTNARLNAEMTQLTQEMASGETADIARHLHGDYAHFGDIEHDTRMLSRYESAAKDATLLTSAMQAALGTAQSTTGALATDLIEQSSGGLSVGWQAASGNAVQAFDTLISALNTDVAGRALFAGQTTDGAPFASSGAFLAALKPALAGATTLNDITTALDTWFDTPGGGFETLGYNGSDQSLAPFLIGEGETVNLDLRGDSPAIRDLLKNTAMAALASDPDLGFSSDLQKGLLASAGEALLGNQDALTGLRADLGYAEARIEESRSRISAEKSSLELARNALVGVDPYETATRLKNVQFQLESLYSATASLSRLSLVGYLK